MRKMRNKASILDILNNIFMLLICAAFLYPFIYTAAISLSSSQPILEGSVILYPKGFTLGAYKFLLHDKNIINSLKFTAELTISGVLASMIVTTCCAYPLSKREFKGRNFFLNIIIFTMYFNGGLIPTFLLVKKIGLTNHIGSLILPNLVDVFLLIIMINYFRGLPVELEESAKVEGANNINIFIKIIIPLAKPVLATLVIFYAVSYWNTFFSALIYIQESKKYPLQVKLYQMLNSAYNSQDIVDLGVIPENLKGATVLTTALPIILIYPLLQKYFIKGVTIGAVKG